MRYKCHKINFKHGRSNIDSPDWIKNKKATINLINKNFNKCCQYAGTVTLNTKRIGKNPKGIKIIGKTLKKIIQQLLLMCYMKKKWKYTPPILWNTNKIMKNKLIIPNGEELHYLAVIKLSALFGWIT